MSQCRKDLIRQTRLSKRLRATNYLESSLGLQAQHLDSAGLALSLCNKMSKTEFEGALTDGRIIRMWGQRNTLHCYDKHTAACFMAWNLNNGNWFKDKWEHRDKRLYENAINRAKEIIESRRTVCKADFLQDGVPECLIDNWGGFFIDLCCRGIAYPLDIGGKRLFRSVDTLDVKELGYEESVRSICRGYFDQYGPASAFDFAHWLGIKTSYARKLISSVEPALCEYDGLFYTSEPETNGPITGLGIERVVIMPRFENMLLAYKDKSWIAESEISQEIWVKSGIIEAPILLDGEIVALWRYNKTIAGEAICIKSLRHLSRAERLLIEESLIRAAEQYWGKVKSFSWNGWLRK